MPVTTSRAQRWPLVLTALGASALFAAGCSPAEEAAAESGPTETEYLQAVDATVECIRAEGYAVTTEPNPDGLTVGISVSASTDARAAMQDTNTRCFAKHLDAVEAEYLAANAATGTERDRLYEELISCLEDNGVTGAKSGMSEGDVTSLIFEQLPDEESRFPAIECVSDRITLFT